MVDDGIWEANQARYNRLSRLANEYIDSKKGTGGLWDLVSKTRFHHAAGPPNLLAGFLDIMAFDEILIEHQEIDGVTDEYLWPIMVARMDAAMEGIEEKILASREGRSCK